MVWHIAVRVSSCYALVGSCEANVRIFEYGFVLLSIIYHNTNSQALDLILCYQFCSCGIVMVFMVFIYVGFP